MPTETVSYQLDDSTEVRFEIDSPHDWSPATGRGRPNVAGQVREAVTPAVEAAKTVLDQIAALKPDGVEVTFGIKVTGEASWVVAKAAAEGSFEVKLTWSPGKPADGEPE